MMNQWLVYVLRCGDNSLYTGVTTDVERRVREHNQDNKLAASYTRSRRPVTLVYTELCSNRSEAQKREMEIKRLTRQQKEGLITSQALSI
jgi:putative endonuclease